MDALLKEYHFKSFKSEQNKMGKLTKIITLVLESVSQGIARAVIETSVGK